jgi:hypothetical protein
MHERTVQELIDAYASQDLYRAMFPGTKPKTDTRTPSAVSAGYSPSEWTELNAR